MSEQLPLTADWEARAQQAEPIPKAKPKQAPRPKKPPQPMLELLPPGAERNEETGERIKPDCQGAPGICPFFRCKWNLVLDVTHGLRGQSGTIQVRRPSGGAVTIPLHRSNDHVMKRGDIEAAGDAAYDVATWLEEQYGSTCSADFPGEHTQQEVARIYRVERQRIQQIEHSAKRNRRLAELAQDAAEQRGRQGGVTWPEPAPRLYAIRKKASPRT